MSTTNKHLTTVREELKKSIKSELGALFVTPPPPKKCGLPIVMPPLYLYLDAIITIEL